MYLGLPVILGMFSSPQVDQDQLPSRMFLLYVTRISVVAGSTLSAPACGTLLTTTGGALVIEGLSIASSCGSSAALGASAAAVGAASAKVGFGSCAPACVTVTTAPVPNMAAAIRAAAIFVFVQVIMVIAPLA